MTIIYFIIMMGLIVSIHEFGHMIVAKIFNVYVREYAIGFGPQIWSKQGKETKYSLRAIPLGGYTAMVESPEEQEEEDENEETVKVPEERTFYGAAWWKRILILLAGPVSNIILAIIVYCLLFQILGYTTVYDKPYIKSVIDNSPAQKAGMEAGDLITKIVYEDGTIVIPKTFDDISTANQMNNYKPAQYYVERNGETLIFSITPEFNEEQQAMMIGITTEPIIKELNFFSAIPVGVAYTFKMIKITVQSIIMLITGKTGMESVGGTIAIYNVTKEAVSYGILSYISLIGTISISIGLMNLVPIPVVDGGRVVLTFVEMIFGEKFTKKFEKYLLIFGWILVVALFIFVTISDIMKMMK